MQRLVVIGLGYVGREVADLAATRGFDVVGVDTDPSVVEAVQRGEADRQDAPGMFEATTDGSDAISEADEIVVTVPTPLDSSHAVDLTPLESATESIAAELPTDPDGTLVVVESTIPPGTISDIVAPQFEMSGYSVGDDVFVAHAPERVDPGNDEWPLAEIPRVVGAATDAGLERAVAFYEELLTATTQPVSSSEVAASSKIIENAYRDINIAFVNEIALTLDELDIDTSEALDAADTKPFGFTRFSPGAGVGGHCIPVDPYFLIRQTSTDSVDNKFMKSARRVNNRMPAYVADQTLEALVRGGTLPQDASVLLLGKSFKPNVSDTRNSPHFPIRSELESYDVDIETYDPELPGESTVDSPYQQVDAAVLVTSHDELSSVDFEKMDESGVDIFVDGRNIFDPDAVRRAGLTYVGVGR